MNETKIKELADKVWKNKNYIGILLTKSGLQAALNIWDLEMSMNKKDFSAEMLSTGENALEFDINSRPRYRKEKYEKYMLFMDFNTKDRDMIYYSLCLENLKTTLPNNSSLEIPEELVYLRGIFLAFNTIAKQLAATDDLSDILDTQFPYLGNTYYVWLHKIKD